MLEDLLPLRQVAASCLSGIPGPSRTTVCLKQDQNHLERQYAKLIKSYKKGPIIDYIANCGDSCETVDKSSLEWVKVQAEGLVDGSSAPGTWASDTLIANGNRWVVTIPESLAAGNYVVRHEIIALHSAGQENGAQNYPQCVNIQVTGGGSDSPSGVLGTELYKADDAGILFNIYQTLDSYPMPGPELYSGAVDAAQEVMEITATSSATTNGDAAVTTSASAITSSIAEVTTTAGVEDTPSTTASIITSATALETIATSAPVATKIAAEEPATTTTRAPCTKQKHRRHARHV